MTVVGGFTAHAILDSVHSSVIVDPGVPSWWPAFCLAIDVVLAAGLAALTLQRRNTNSLR
jgi:hypothetical protein